MVKGQSRKAPGITYHVTDLPIPIFDTALRPETFSFIIYSMLTSAKKALFRNTAFM
jgi:hypothetical protein